MKRWKHLHFWAWVKRNMWLPWCLRWYSVCRQCGRPKFNPWVRKISWRRKWQPTPVLLPEKSYGQRSLVGYSPWGRKESDMTERLHFHFERGVAVPVGQCTWDSPGGPVQAGPDPSDSSKFPSDADTAGSGPLLWRPLQWRNRKPRRQGGVTGCGTWIIHWVELLSSLPLKTLVWIWLEVVDLDVTGVHRPMLWPEGTRKEIKSQWQWTFCSGRQIFIKPSVVL